jgi:hypothetical protein
MNLYIVIVSFLYDHFLFFNFKVPYFHTQESMWKWFKDIDVLWRNYVDYSYSKGCVLSNCWLTQEAIKEMLIYFVLSLILVRKGLNKLSTLKLLDKYELCYIGGYCFMSDEKSHLSMLEQKHWLWLCLWKLVWLLYFIVIKSSASSCYRWFSCLIITEIMYYWKMQQ